MYIFGTIELKNYFGLERSIVNFVSEFIGSEKKSDTVDRTNMNQVRSIIIKVENILIEREGDYMVKIYQSMLKKELTQTQK